MYDKERATRTYNSRTPGLERSYKRYKEADVFKDKPDTMITLLEATHSQCVWPVNQHINKMHVCGQFKTAGSGHSYCAKHDQISRSGIPPKKIKPVWD